MSERFLCYRYHIQQICEYSIVINVPKVLV